MQVIGHGRNAATAMRNIIPYTANKFIIVPRYVETDGHKASMPIVIRNRCILTKALMQCKKLQTGRLHSCLIWRIWDSNKSNKLRVSWQAVTGWRISSQPSLRLILVLFT